MLQSACVLTRSHAVGMWQTLLEEGVLNHGKSNLFAAFSCSACCLVSIYAQKREELNKCEISLRFGHIFVCSSVDQELGFQDKYLFYRFLDDEEEDTPLPSEEERRESEEELPETILFLAQIGPDALLRMILRKSSVTINNYNSFFIAPSLPFYLQYFSML